MAGITRGARILITRDILMILRKFYRVVVLMAINTTEGGIIAANMAFNALIPFSFVFSRVNREVHIVMVKGGGYPGSFRVTSLTICGETR